MIFQNRNKYEAYWKNDKMHRIGIGKLTFANGDENEGDFFQNEMHGYGRKKWQNGCVYKGEWVHGESIGQGI